MESRGFLCPPVRFCGDSTNYPLKGIETRCGWVGGVGGSDSRCQRRLYSNNPSTSFFCRPNGTVACGGGRQRRRLQQTQSDLAADASHKWREVRFFASARRKQREERVTATVRQQRSKEMTMMRFPSWSDALYLDPLLTKLCETFFFLKKGHVEI